MSRRSKEKVRPEKAAARRFNPSASPSGNRDWIFSLVLVMAVIVAYQPALRGQFVWDDDSWTTGISGMLRDFSGLHMMWFHPMALQQYYPLAGTSFWIDYQLWGFWTLPYHIENVLLHAFAALLFWKLLQRLQVPGAKLAGALFALHPVMVESVAWITERKNVLSLVFYLGTLLAYGRFMNFWKEESPSGVAVNRLPRRRWIAYALAFLLFLCAYLAKATAFSIPAVVPLICWWKRGRIRWRADVLPAIPFLVFSIGLGLLTSWLEKHHLRAAGPEWAISFPERCLIAGRAPWFYIGKLIWPANFCFVYPRWQLDVGAWWQWIFPVAAIGVLLGLWFVRDRIGRGPAAAAFYFVGTLFPVLGFMNAYFMRFSFVCDHWVYLSSLGLIALSASVIVQTLGRLRRPAVLWGFVVVLLPVLAILTWRQSRMYADMETLWQTTLRLNSNCWMAHANLGSTLLHKGELDRAITHCQRALEIKPDNSEARNNLAIALAQKGSVDEAIIHFQKVVEIKPDYAEGHNNLGNVLLQKGSVDEAITHFQNALSSPNIEPMIRGKVESNLGNALLSKGQVEQAILHYQAAIKIAPDNGFNLNNLAWVLATAPQASLRDGNKAVELAQRANQLSGGADPMILHTLAAAYAEAGRFPEAIETAERALQLGVAQSDAVLTEKLRSALRLYQAGKSLHGAE